MFSSSASILEIFIVAHRPTLLLFINEDEFREGVKSDKSIKKGRWIQPAPLLLTCVGSEPYLFGAHLGPPLVEARLVPIDDVGHYHAGDGKNQHADEDFISLKGCAGDRDHETDARRGGIELADHDADQGATDR